MHSLWSAAVQYTNYSTGGALELPTQSGTLCNNSFRDAIWLNMATKSKNFMVFQTPLGNVQVGFTHKIIRQVG